MSAAMTPILNEFMNTSSSVVRGACACSQQQSVQPRIIGCSPCCYINCGCFLQGCIHVWIGTTELCRTSMMLPDATLSSRTMPAAWLAR